MISALLSCTRAGWDKGPTALPSVRRLADSLQAPVRAALSRQEAALVFTLTGPTFNGIPGGISLRDWGVFPRRRSPQYRLDHLYLRRDRNGRAS